MNYRVFRPFLILASALLLQNHVLHASNDQHEEERQVPRRVSDAEALDRFSKLKQSRGLIGINLAKVSAATSSATPPISSPKGRVRFDDSTMRRHKAVESTDSSAPENQTAQTALFSAHVMELSDQLGSTTLGDSVPKRSRSRSMTDNSKTLQKKRVQPKLDANAVTELSMDFATFTSALKDELLVLPSAPVASSSNADVDAIVSKPRTRVKKRSQSTNESRSQKIRRDDSFHEAQVMVHAKVKSPRATSSIEDRVESPPPLSPRVLEEGKAPPTNSLYASLVQSMFYVPEKKSYYKTTAELTKGSSNAVIQKVLDALNSGETGYKYKVDFSAGVEKLVDKRNKALVYPLSLHKGAQKLFTFECYKTEEGPIGNMGEAIKAALKPTDATPHYGLSETEKLVVTQYREDITEEDRTIFINFKSSAIDRLKKHPFNVIGVKSFDRAHTYETDKGNIQCLADLERVGYTYFMLGLKEQDFLGFIRVSSYAPDWAQSQATSSAPQKVSASSSAE